MFNHDCDGGDPWPIGDEENRKEVLSFNEDDPDAKRFSILG